MLVSYAQVASILQKALGQEEGLIVLEFIMSRIPDDVARQRDIEELRLVIKRDMEELRLKIERDIEELRLEIKKVRAETSVQIERLRSELVRQIEEIRADLHRAIAEAKSSQTRWAFLFWASQMALLLSLVLRAWG